MNRTSFLMAAMLAAASCVGYAQPADEVAPASAFSEALASLRKNRPSEAYGRLVRLADGGHADAARIVLVMLRHGSTLYGTEWTAAPSQVAAWERTVRRAKPLQVVFVGE